MTAVDEELMTTATITLFRLAMVPSDFVQTKFSLFFEPCLQELNNNQASALRQHYLRLLVVQILARYDFRVTQSKMTEHDMNLKIA